MTEVPYEYNKNNSRYSISRRVYISWTMVNPMTVEQWLVLAVVVSVIWALS